MKEQMFMCPEWYIAELKRFEAELATLAPFSLGKHRGVTVIRISDGNGKYREISPSSKIYPRASKIAFRRAELIKIIKRYKYILSQHYKVNYDDVKSGYVITPNSSSAFDNNHFNNLITNDCRIENNNEYAFNGINYRSRFEMTAATELTYMGIEFKYEPRVDINPDKNRYADFCLNFVSFNRCVFIELLGSMNKENYRYDNSRKMSEYLNKGFYIGRDLFIMSGDDKYMPGPGTIQSQIYTIVMSLCELYMRKE